MNRSLLFIIASIIVLSAFYSAYSWSPTPIASDRLVFMPGTQPGDAGNSESPNKCDNCHGGYNIAVEPAYTWRGSMMAQAARDPLWLACLTTSLQDSIWALGNPNAGDLCIRCHSPTGWLEGRSDPPNTSALMTSDFDGVQCDFCHRMIDPLTQLGQPDVDVETDPTAIIMAEETRLRDINILGNHFLFDGTPFLNTTSNLPINIGDGDLPNYIENSAGQFFVDASNAKSGPFWDANARHQMYYSRYHKSQSFCFTCHDVSNPVLARLFIGIDTPETQSASTYFHVERTASEFLLSQYGSTGASTQIPGVPWAEKCQDCHMRDVTGLGCNKRGTQVRNDLPLHDLTGGNQWISRILASVDPNGPIFDNYNYIILSGQKYSGAQIDVSGINGFGNELLSGSERAIQQLQMAADLNLVGETQTDITIQVQNNGGHKLISGFPEGRRMWLNIKFFDSIGNLIDEINPYEPLVTNLDPAGDEVYVSGGILNVTDDQLVWEAQMSSNDLTSEVKTFHFVLATNRYKDNRIPPKGFDTSNMFTRMVQPRWNGVDAPEYFTTEEYSGGYDEVNIVKPDGTASWYATLYYQTTSKEYIEFLRDEINGVGGTLTSPTPSGEQNAYIVQTDPFFQNLKDWGIAIWDLWLHNNGAEPVVMSTAGDVPPSTCSINSPQNLAASGSKRSITLTWDPVDNAGSYNVYYSQNGKYTLATNTQNTSYRENKIQSGQTVCYAVSALVTCQDGTVTESEISTTACGIAG